MSIENARQALELLISKPKAGIFFEMEMLISEKDQKTRKELEEVYAYAITLAVELLRRAETDAIASMD